MYILIDTMIIIFVYMTALFLYALHKKDNSIVDVGWGIGFIIIALYSFFKAHLYLPRHYIILAMIVIWGLRISLHILCKNWKKGEDPRYALMRKKWGDHVVWRSFLQVFMLQGLVMFIVAQPILIINGSFDATIGWLDRAGICVWIIGFLFEVVGDYQLLTFIKNSKNHGHILTTGLWRYTRHPNYFGEATMWWGIFLIALSGHHGWTSIMSPATITFLLMYISGVPMAEASMKGNPEFKKYAQKTSVFFPWLPGK